MAKSDQAFHSKPSGASFGELLEKHLLAGTRPRGSSDQGRAWGRDRFAEKIGISDRQLRNWLKNKSLPNEIETIEEALFGKNQEHYRDWRIELRAAHRRAKLGDEDPLAETRRPPRASNASNIPVRVPTHFVGRDDALSAIEAAHGQNPNRVAVVALQGLRGIGKTTLAAAYAERHFGKYRATWWIRAQTEELMRADLVGLGLRLGWVRAEDAEAAALATIMEQLRNESEDILLIYDNATDADSLDRHLPRGGRARVLVTSNLHALRHVAEPVEVTVWSKETGAEYLLARTGRDNERKTAEMLADVLGGLPLAHEQAAAYCDKLSVSLVEYLNRFERMPTRLLDRFAPVDHNDGMTVMTSFALGIEEAAKLHPAAESLIVQAALLAAEPIPLSLFFEAREKLGEPIASALADDGLDEAVAALNSFALLKRETIVDERDPAIATDTIRLHRLVREVAAARSDKATLETMRRALLATLASLYPKDVFDEPRTWPFARRLDEHVRFLTDDCASSLKGEEKPIAQLLDRLASYRQGALAAYASARPLYERALAIRESSFGPEAPLTAASLHHFARLLRDQGDFAGARMKYERALAIREKTLGPDHRHTAATLNNLASLLQAQGVNLGQVRSMFERALAIREKELGSEHPHTAASLVNVARVLRDQAEFATAQPFAERGLAIREKVLGAEHPRTAASLNVLASVVQGRGDHDAALPKFERALAICERVLGPDHPYTATSLTNLALLFQVKENFARARQLFERALALRERVLGADHPSTATSLNDLGGLLLAQRDPARVHPLFERALKICEKVLGPDHPATATSLAGIAYVLQRQDRAAEAHPLLQRAFAIRNKVLGPDHPATAAIRDALKS